MMVVVDWRLALVAFGVIPVMLLVAAVFRRSVRQAFHDIRIRVARINSFLQEHLSGMRVVQLFGREEVTAREFAVINKDHLSAHLRSITVYALFFPAVEFLGSVALGALLWYGGLRVLDQTLTVGILAAFIQLTRRFFQPLQDLAEKYNLLQSAMASSERIFRLMDTQPTVLEPVHPKRLARPFRGEVVFEDVWFRYGGDRVPGSEFRVAESDEATSNAPQKKSPRNSDPGTPHRQLGPQGRQLHGTPGSDACHRRAHRGGEDHDHQPAAPFLRSAAGPDYARRCRPSRVAAGSTA
jgi:ATP-binding cassette subfamily B protein